LRLRIIPSELLARTTSAELGEIFAYYSLQQDEREAERTGSSGDVEQDLRKAFGRPQS